MNTPSSFAFAGIKAVALSLLIAGAGACRDKSPIPDKEAPAPPVSASASASAETATARAAPAPTLPTLAPVKFAPADSHPSAVFAVEGALVVVEDSRVGRIVGEGIEWIGKIPRDTPALGANLLDAVYGLWPDGLAAVYRTGNGRAPQPTYFPLTGKEHSYRVADGGGWGSINGVARVGASTIVVGNSMSTGVELVTVRGPRLARKALSPDQGGCKKDEVRRGEFMPAPPAITPLVLESSPEGTLVSLGRLCERNGGGAEIWDKSGKSRIVDLGRWWKNVSYRATLLKGNGDELWAFSDPWSPALHYRNGEIEPVPELGRPIRSVFVSPRGQLHASDGQTVHRHEDGKWIPIAHLAPPAGYGSMVMDDQGAIWVASGGVVSKLREAPGVAVPEGCSPFVYLYEVSPKNAKDFTFPATQQALATFPEVAALGLVEFEDIGRHLGLTVASQAQGEAVIAHLKATMKDEDPRFYCYAPRAPRKIVMGPKDK